MVSRADELITKRKLSEKQRNLKHSGKVQSGYLLRANVDKALRQLALETNRSISYVADRIFSDALGIEPQEDE